MTFLGALGVLGDEGLDRVVEHGYGEGGHLDDPVANRLRHRGQAAQAQDVPGDALGVVAHPLELEVDLDRAVGEAEVDAHGLLPHEELEAEPVDRLLLLVDVLVAQDDRVGLLAAAALEADTQSRRPVRRGRTSRGPRDGFDRCRAPATPRDGWPWLPLGSGGERIPAIF